MPELPEVETIAKQLACCLIGQTIANSVVRWPRSIATHDPTSFHAALCGKTISAVSRRGKYILVSVPPQTMLIHLRMTGRLFACSRPAAMDTQHPHLRAYWEMDSGDKLFFVDVRKFGRIYLVDSVAEKLGDLGPEPFDPALTGERFAALLQSRRRQIKPLLLDQRFVAGLGNIYVDESLWRAGLHPEQRSHTIKTEQAERLLCAIRATLREAINDGGTTLRDYRNAQNVAGDHAPALAVYGKQGEPCPRCGSAIERSVVGSRGTHLCLTCQPLVPGVSDKDEPEP